MSNVTSHTARQAEKKGARPKKAVRELKVLRSPVVNNPKNVPCCCHCHCCNCH